MTEYCFFCGRYNPCERKTKEGNATDYYLDCVSNAMRSILSTSGKKIKYSISVVRQICQSHRAEINKPVLKKIWIPDIDWVLHLGLEWQVRRQRKSAFWRWIIMLPYFFSCFWSPSDIVGVYLGVHWLNLLGNEVFLLVAISLLFDEDWKELAWFFELLTPSITSWKKVDQKVIFDVMSQ